MYTPTKLTEYLDKYGISWAKTLPENTPPEDIVVALYLVAYYIV